jgi:hypothetical protein
MSYMDIPDDWHRRLRRPLSRRGPDWRPDTRIGVISDVVAEFPGYGVDGVLAEARLRGADVTPEFVRAVIHTLQVCSPETEA